MTTTSAILQQRRYAGGPGPSPHVRVPHEAAWGTGGSHKTSLRSSFKNSGQSHKGVSRIAAHWTLTTAIAGPSTPTRRPGCSLTMSQSTSVLKLGALVMGALQRARATCTGRMPDNESVFPRGIRRSRTAVRWQQHALELRGLTCSRYH